MHRVIPGLLGLLLAACGNGTDVGSKAETSPAVRQNASRLDQVPDAGRCDRLASAQWIVEPGCTGCVVANPAAVADGDEQTFASVTFPATLEPRSGGAAIRASASPGVVYEPGHQVAAFLREPNEMLDYDLYVRTYLGGALQESNGYHGLKGTRDDTEALTSFVATKPFDAVEYYIRVASSQTDAVGEIVELCLDYNN